LSQSRAGFVRRAIDIGGAIFLMVVLSPLFAAISIAVWLDSPGPVIFRQTRVGINRRRPGDRRVAAAAVANDRRRTDRRTTANPGRLYEIQKFRTMVDGAEAGAGPQWAREDDGRITRVGRMLRRTRLDELPQVWNVLVGDMSFIGPRPERPTFVKRFEQTIPRYLERLAVAPGITGLAQVEGGYDASEDDVRVKLSHDLAYIENRSLPLDLEILAKTVRVVLTGRGAR